ncbi:dihydrofolate reductase family protein [Sphingomonas sp. CROZ-RG-20F-R02-07]|uniref:dihydrofolate reductase family protein n=1 Tax=Sphingomonas sp. CROZ-RG-20F-R02-07 TaxID=2914832 RepID=UPI001F5A196D|nr:dihydrofolate reductase family protein [Sphingomonas sp. CROZ-RG-20F-R02-07]
MRDLILKMSMSLDGFVSDPEGDNRWMFGGDPEAKAWSIAHLWEGGLHIMGSRTFAAMASHWPGSTDPFAAPMNAVPKAVFTQHGAAVLPAPCTAGGWGDAYVASGDLGEEIAALKAEGGKPIIAHGGVRFARGLLAAGLVDRLVLMVIPVALGRGLSVFADLAAPLPLTLIQARAFPGGAVAHIYRA